MGISQNHSANCLAQGLFLTGFRSQFGGYAGNWCVFTPARKSMPAIDYVSIVRSGYNDRRAMVVGAFACVLCTSVTGYLTGAPGFFAIAAGFVVSAIFRFIDMTRFKNADIGPTDVEVAARWEVRATYHAAIFAFLCGMW